MSETTAFLLIIVLDLAAVAGLALATAKFARGAIVGAIAGLVIEVLRIMSAMAITGSAGAVHSDTFGWLVNLRVYNIRRSRLRESGEARIHVNASWMKRLRGSLAAMHLVEGCPAAAAARGAGGSFLQDVRTDRGRVAGGQQSADGRAGREGSW